MGEVEPLPQNYPHVTPYLHVDGASAALDFYTEVFGATERMRMPGDTPDSIGHAELQLGNSVIMLADEFPNAAAHGRTLQRTTDTHRACRPALCSGSN